ncbi:Fis family transcriptional regulator [bacterium (candidate division B38) B3_B38]|nr:MAG: Fis family transcriptional regulator [bacterium (candidate division B38) B3_B38]
MERIMVVDDEKSMRDFLSIMLEKEGYTVSAAKDGTEAKGLIDGELIDLVIADIKMPETNGIELLEYIRQVSPETIVIMITAYASTETAIQALKLGAYDYITKPFNVDEIRIIIEKALEKKRLKEENIYLKKELQLRERQYFDSIVGKNKKMVALYRLIEQIAPTNTTVLICGESGTGKELIARAIHYHSPRRDKQFVSINCGALPETLLESELFGYLKGAFTGATSNKKGLFEVANGGSFLLDEIGEMSPSMQVKLLRVLQDKIIRRLGGLQEIKVDVRIITSTNQDLQRLVEEKKFREDLFYRVNVMQIRIPPLRERRDDILLLANHFLSIFTKETGKNIQGFHEQTKAYLESYDWPGNVRELENVVERAVALETTNLIMPERLPEKIYRDKMPSPDSPFYLPDEGMKLEEHIVNIRKKFMASALEKAGGMQKRAAALLGMTFRSFRYFIKKYGLR